MSFTEPKLWEHQNTALARSRPFPHYAYFMEQGTGKTLTAIKRMRELFHEARRPLKTLILCPDIVVKNWKSEIERFSMCGSYVQILKGPTKKRIEALKQGERDGKRIFITNLEMLAVGDGLLWETKEHGKTKSRVPIRHGWELLIIDESHRVKDYRSSSTKMAIKIADHVYYKLLLTGTPILNSESDIWSQFRILDGGETFGKTFLAFQREYFYDANAGMPSQRYFPNWKLRPGMDLVLNERIYRRAYRVLKEECLDLPPLVFKRIAVELSAKQQKHYEEMRRDFITYVEELRAQSALLAKGGEIDPDTPACTAQMAVTKALRLQQIVTGFMKLDTGEEVYIDAAPRLNALSELLADMAGRKVIVWATFQQNYAAIAAICDKLKLSYTFITGLQTKAEKDKAEYDFTKGDIQVLIANPGAGGTGVNLVEADTAIWFSRSFNLAHRLQALARNHRGGSERHTSITVYDLVADATIDVAVLDRLDEKESVANGILTLRV